MSKLSLWSRDGAMLERQTRANAGRTTGGLQRLDTRGIGDWLVTTLAGWRDHPVEAIVPVAHGAAIAAIAGEELAFPPLDYEQHLPAAQLAAYRRERDAFAITGSPALPNGLNMGGQLYALQASAPRFPEATLLPWAQYWAWFLSGVGVSEVTSLGCHSDLWAPASADFSPMAKRLGWAGQFAPLAGAEQVISTLRPALALATGLSGDVRIYAGLHDSNAALLAVYGFPELAANQDITVLSTGTWFIALRKAPASGPGAPFVPSAFTEARDCLVNIDVTGRQVPSARFMGGREVELLGHRIDRPGLAGLDTALASGAMVLPGGVPGCGPYPNARGGWLDEPTDSDTRTAAVALMAALTTETSLNLIGTRDRLVIEGRFATSELYTRALASLLPDTEVLIADGEVDVSFGALRLIDPTLRPAGALRRVAPLDVDLESYRARWLAAVESVQ